MYLHTYVNNWSSALSQEFGTWDTALYVPQAALDLLPNLSADGDIAIPLVIDDGAGNYEFVEAYQKTTGYLTVIRDMYDRYGTNPTWPISTPIYCRPFAEIMTECQQSFLTRKDYAPAGASASINPREADGRFISVTLIQNLTLTFYTTVVTTPIVDRVNKFTLALIQDATGGHSITFVANILWEGGSPPTFDTTADSIVLIEFFEVDLDADIWIASVLANGAI